MIRKAIYNSFVRIRFTAKREFLHVIRDIRTLYLSFLLPIILIFLFGYAVDIDIDRIPIGICSSESNSKVREFIYKLTAGNWFELKTFTTNCKQIEKELHDEYIHIGIILPSEFVKKLNRNEPLEIQAIIDGTDNISSTTGLNYLKLFLFYYQENLILKNLNRLGIKLDYPVEILPIVLFNTELKSKFFLLPGIIVLTIAILSALLTSLTISREWELGTMEQLISTPIKNYEIILGKLLPYIGISILQTIIVSIFAVNYFDVPFKGNWLYLVFSSLFFSIGSLSLGIMISSIMKSQLPSIQGAMMATMIPTMIFSGFVFPIESMPVGIQFITYLIAPRYFLNIIRSIFLKGTGISFWYIEILFLILYSIFILTIATIKLQKRLQ
jgi:ABC-2 type transport system permease protein